MDTSKRRYEYDGILYNLTGSKAFHDKMETDLRFAEQIIKSVQSGQLNTENTFLLGNDQENSAAKENQVIHTEEPLPQDDESIDFEEHVEENMNQSQWNDDSIKLLLEEYRIRIDKFRNPSVKKKILYREISNVLKKHNFNFSQKTVHSKMRNMKSTFMKAKNTNKKSGSGRITWPWYDKMAEIFANDESVNLNENQFIENYPMASSSPEIPQTEKEDEETSDEESAEEDKRSNKKRRAKKDLYHQRKKQLDMEAEKLKTLELLTTTIQTYQVEAVRRSERQEQLMLQYLEAVNRRTETLGEIMQRIRQFPSNN